MLRDGSEQEEMKWKQALILPSGKNVTVHEDLAYNQCPLALQLQRPLLWKIFCSNRLEVCASTPEFNLTDGGFLVFNFC
jgi:hypothetical protein